MCVCERERERGGGGVGKKERDSLSLCVNETQRQIYKDNLNVILLYVSQL